MSRSTSWISLLELSNVLQVSACSGCRVIQMTCWLNAVTGSRFNYFSKAACVEFSQRFVRPWNASWNNNLLLAQIGEKVFQNILSSHVSDCCVSQHIGHQKIVIKTVIKGQHFTTVMPEQLYWKIQWKFQNLSAIEETWCLCSSSLVLLLKGG